MTVETPEQTQSQEQVAVKSNLISSLQLKRNILDTIKEYETSIKNLDELTSYLAENSDDEDKEELNKQKIEIDKVKDEYKEFISKSLEEYKNVPNNESTFPNMINDIKTQIDNVKDNQVFKNIYSELTSSYDLHILYKANKNKKYDVSAYLKNWKREFDKFRKTLEEEKNFHFKDPIKIYDILKTFLPETDVMLFLYSFGRFINPKRKKGIKKYAIFISELINNIYSIPKEYTNDMTEDKKEELKLRQSVRNEISNFIQFVKTHNKL